MDQKLSKQSKQKTKDLILELIKIQKPQTTTQLIILIKQKTGYTQEQIQDLLVDLENEEKLSFTKKINPLPPTIKAFLLSKNASWYWLTIALVTTTSISVFIIPENSFLLSYLRLTLGAIFLLFLPGYVIIKAIFPINIQINTKSQSIDQIERIALSIGLSISLTPMVGLILNFTPWGIRLIPITLSLLLLTIIFATIAILREFQIEFNLLPQQNTKKSSEKKTKKTKI